MVALLSSELVQGWGHTDLHAVASGGKRQPLRCGLLGRGGPWAWPGGAQLPPGSFPFSAFCPHARNSSPPTMLALGPVGCGLKL